MDQVRTELMKIYFDFGIEQLISVSKEILSESYEQTKGSDNQAYSLRGDVGEIVLECQLIDYVKEKSDYVIMSGLTIPFKTRTGFTEIDMVLITKKRIFLFEAKCNYGQININEDGTVKTEFNMYDPYTQSNIHLAALKETLSDIVSNEKLYSIALYMFGNNTIKNHNKTDMFVLDDKSIEKFLGKTFNKGPDLIDMSKVYTCLSKHHKNSAANFKKHKEILVNET